MTAIPWEVDARIVIRQGNEPSEWEGTLVDCLDIWLRLSVVAQHNAEIFVKSPVLGKSAIDPSMIECLVAHTPFKER